MAMCQSSNSLGPLSKQHAAPTPLCRISLVQTKKSASQDFDCLNVFCIQSIIIPSKLISNQFKLELKKRAT